MDKKQLAKIADSCVTDEVKKVVVKFYNPDGVLEEKEFEATDEGRAQAKDFVETFDKGRALIVDSIEEAEEELTHQTDSNKTLNLKSSKKVADEYAEELEEQRKNRHFVGDVDGLDVEIFSDGTAPMDDIKEQVKVHIPAIKETLTGNLARPFFGATDGKVDSLRVALSSKTGDEERIKAYDGDSYPETIGEFHFVEVENEEIHDTNYEFGDYML